MKRSLLFPLAAACGAAGLAHAQAVTAYGPDNGFFRPAPDVSLTAPRSAGSAPQAYQQPYLSITTPQVAPAVVTPMPVPATVTVAPPVVNRGIANPAAANAAIMNPTAGPAVVQPGSAAMNSTSTPMGFAAPPVAAAQASVERQMDRSENEADRARVQMMTTPPGVGAAFDGTTSSENR